MAAVCGFTSDAPVILSSLIFDALRSSVLVGNYMGIGKPSERLTGFDSRYMTGRFIKTIKNFRDAQTNFSAKINASNDRHNREWHAERSPGCYCDLFNYPYFHVLHPARHGGPGLDRVSLLTVFWLTALARARHPTPAQCFLATCQGTPNNPGDVRGGHGFIRPAAE